MKKKLLLIVLSVAATAFVAGYAAAGGPADEPGKGPLVVVKGKIAHMERLGGYYVKSENPPEI